ncbi:MAG: hypothetical protein KGM47_07880 [Acidobacteriota bacterium]|nr:hypothetical protein [Acidobacteriota bacterium]
MARGIRKAGKLAPVLAAGLLVISSAVLLEAKQEIGTYDQILLVRGLAHEVAIAKVPLPWGKHGIRVEPNGEVDQAAAVKELHKRGESVRPGLPVEITDIKFKPGHIVFAINGGGKTGEHWYQHLQIGMGPFPQPLMQSQSSNGTTPSNGSYITLDLPARDGSPTVTQVKKLLSEVLDFSRRAPTVLYSPSVPPEYKEAIKNHQVAVGMNKPEVLSAKGPPDRKVHKALPNGSVEDDWLYGDPPHVLFVTFTDDSVSSIHQY